MLHNGYVWPKWPGDSDVDDIVMLLTLWWWLIWADGQIIMFSIFSLCWGFSQCYKSILTIYWIDHQHPESVTNISILSSTQFVSNIQDHHRCSRTDCIRVFCISFNEYSKIHRVINLNTLEYSNSPTLSLTVKL